MSPKKKSAKKRAPAKRAPAKTPAKLAAVEAAPSAPKRRMRLGLTVPPSNVLGTAILFAILAGTTITNTGASVVNGDVGLSPGSAIVPGSPPWTVNGNIFVDDPKAVQAKTDLDTAFATLDALTPATDKSGIDLGGTTLGPGNYSYAAGAGLTGALTLDASGDPNAVFVFQITTTLITAAASSVLLINGAQAKNVYFVVGSSATLGTTTAFQGNILAQTDITVDTGASVNGRLLARDGEVTLDTNLVTAPLTAPKLFGMPAGYQNIPNPYNLTVSQYQGGTTSYPLGGLRIGRRYAAVEVERSRGPSPG